MGPMGRVNKLAAQSAPWPHLKTHENAPKWDIYHEYEHYPSFPGMEMSLYNI